MRKGAILSVLILVGCTSVKSIPQDVRNPCSTGDPFGVACIDPATNTPRVDPIHSGNGQIVNAFFTTGSDELDITSDAFVWHRHQGSHAWAQLRSDLTVKRNYKYTVHNLTRNTAQDPDIMIDY